MDLSSGISGSPRPLPETTLLLCEKLVAHAPFLLLITLLRGCYCDLPFTTRHESSTRLMCNRASGSAVAEGGSRPG